MSADVLSEIIELCLSIDSSAQSVYGELSKLYEKEDSRLSGFWRQMEREESEHVQFWTDILPLAQQKLIPQIFDQPYAIKEELTQIAANALKLKDGDIQAPHFNRGFVLAYRLEFYLLHPAFEVLFNFAQDIKPILNINMPWNNYEQHVDHFIVALNHFGNVTPEMELLGETLKRMWRENKQLALQGNTDTLTGVLNRRGFFAAVNPLVYFANRNNNHVGVLMIDIDFFKKINDTYGHQKGDEVLHDIGHIIKSAIRKSDICGRYGGEEFIVFLSSVVPGATRDVSENIRKTIENKKPAGIDVTVSIGAYDGKLPGKDTEIQENLTILIKKADACLYQAKEAGRNRVMFCP